MKLFFSFLFYDMTLCNQTPLIFCCFCFVGFKYFLFKSGNHFVYLGCRRRRCDRSSGRRRPSKISTNSVSNPFYNIYKLLKLILQMLTLFISKKVGHWRSIGNFRVGSLGLVEKKFTRALVPYVSVL
jgi:hypothetical protein